jgi:hypothetical protein
MKNALIKGHSISQATFVRQPLALAIGLTLLSSLPMRVVAANSVTAALTGGKASGNIRIRSESVSDDAVAKDGDALTIRTRLGYETAPYKGFSLFAEFEDIHTMFGQDDYAPETVAVPAYATVLDRTGSEMNRAFVRYRGVPKLDLAYGRQRIIYDNARFVGNVGWRQDEQTFDGFTAVYTGLPDFTFNYAYLTQVNGVDVTLDTTKISDNLLNASYNGFTWGKFTGYAYLLDHEDETDTTVNAGLRFKTSDTVGLRFEGAYALPITAMVKVLYAAEYAQQDFENTAGTVEREADYTFAELGLNYVMPTAILTGKVSYEVLGSDDGLYGFQTPYATKHAFTGWADKFLATPAAGLEDKFVTLNAVFPGLGGLNVLAMYHDYASDEGSFDYGKEWNLQVMKPFAPNYQVGIKYAAYSEGDLPYRDTDKLWIWGEFNF